MSKRLFGDLSETSLSQIIDIILIEELRTVNSYLLQFD